MVYPIKRSFDENHVERLKKISILRKLGLGTEVIRLLLNDENKNDFKTLTMRSELNLEQEKVKYNLLNKLSENLSWQEISSELECLEKRKMISEKILDAFPGHYGYFIYYHFSSFLDEPIETEEQQDAFDQIIEFLDGVTIKEIDKEIENALTDKMNAITLNDIKDIADKSKDSIKDPIKFFEENKDVLMAFSAYRKTKEYKESEEYKIHKLVKDFCKTVGYYDIFIPALQVLSASYKKHYEDAQSAHKLLLEKYPELEQVKD